MSEIKLHDLVPDLIQTLKAANVEQPQFEVRQIVQEALKITELEWVAQSDRSLDPDTVRRLNEWTQARAQGVPLPYLCGHRGFYKSDFLVEAGVLVPRPETELVVEAALRRMDKGTHSFMADLGSGTGCIGLSVLLERKGLKLWSVDLSPLACELTRKNAQRLGLSSRVEIECKSVEERSPSVQFDLIVANPPYIAENDPNVERAVHKYEPHQALYSGADGLEAIRKWTRWSFLNLREEGILVMEFGAGQAESVQKIFSEAGFEQIQIDRDLAQHERVISALRKRN